jgi:hypothetical protein
MPRGTTIAKPPCAHQAADAPCARNPIGNGSSLGKKTPPSGRSDTHRRRLKQPLRVELIVVSAASQYPRIAGFINGTNQTSWAIFSFAGRFPNHWMTGT